MKFICKKKLDKFEVGKTYDLRNEKRYFTYGMYYYAKKNFDDYFETIVENRRKKLNELVKKI